MGRIKVNKRYCLLAGANCAYRWAWAHKTLSGSTIHGWQPRWNWNWIWKRGPINGPPYNAEWLPFKWMKLLEITCKAEVEEQPKYSKEKRHSEWKTEWHRWYTWKMQSVNIEWDFKRLSCNVGFFSGTPRGGSDGDWVDCVYLRPGCANTNDVPRFRGQALTGSANSECTK